MLGSTSNTTPDRDIIIEPKFGKLQRVSYIHPKFMALQYPLLFPNGEDGYHDKIPFQSADLSNLKERDFISMKDFYAYRFQIRPNHCKFCYYISCVHLSYKITCFRFLFLGFICRINIFTLL